MKATFLLGSGISISAGLPSVGKITKAILSGDGLVINPDGRVVDEDELSDQWVEQVRVSMIEEGREKVRRILLLLDWLKVQVNCRYAEIEGRLANYEDLAYLAGQISDDLGDEYENPALQPFVRKALIDLKGLFPDSATYAAREGLRELARTTVNYIRQVVARELRTPLSDTSYLRVFADACKDSLVSEVNLFTLNHDTLLERILKENDVNVVDGFKEAGDGSRRWDASVFDNPDDERRVNLFKLHGSVNWWRWETRHGLSQDRASHENVDRNRRFVGTYRAPDSDPPLYERLLESEGPQILAGTFNKILGYNSELFLELHHRFHRVLQDCNALVVCGYGFGDKGINTRIAEWRQHSSLPKLLIIDPAESSVIVQRARGSVYREIAAIDPNTMIDPLSPGAVKHWQNGLADSLITWEKIRTELEAS